ncbi:MAG: polyphosphate kinase 2 family protein [Candidatus Nanopelagicales bacterium]
MASRDERSSELRDRAQHLIAALRVPPGQRVRLPEGYDSGYSDPDLDKASSLPMLQEGIAHLAELQDKLYSQDTYGVLLILQAMDAAGKDGTIKHVMSGINPQGVEVTSFKAPSTEELDHTYLWRYAKATPPRGHIGIFNRSHYENVLVVRVHEEFLDAEKLPPSARSGDIWARRYDEINDFEKHLVDNGIKVVKIFLNVGKEEQRRRFLSRIDDPTKNRKFSANDVTERGYWDDYQRAFAEAISATSTEWAPWYIVPADKKWFARISAAAILAHTLIAIDPQYPTISEQARAALADSRAALLAEGPLPADYEAEEAEPAEMIGGQGQGKKGKRSGKKDKAAKASKGTEGTDGKGRG